MKKTTPTSIPSPEMIKAANNLMKASGSINNVDLVNNFILDKIKEEGSPKIRKIFDEVFKNESERSLIFVSQVFARHFNLEEMSKMVSYYNSPIGKRYVKKLPEILEEILKEYTKRLPIVLKKLRTRLDKIDY